MAQRIPTRLGDGSLVELTRAEIEADLIAGSEAAVKRAKVEPLTQDDVDHLVDIFTSPAKFSSVDYGDEVVLSFDGSGNADISSPVLEQVIYQNHHGADRIELWHHDYSYKAVRTVLPFQTQMLKDARRPAACCRGRTRKPSSRPCRWRDTSRRRRRRDRAALPRENRSASR
jgi:dimethylamine--corrinoid protein Co-methyltransferase